MASSRTSSPRSATHDLPSQSHPSTSSSRSPKREDLASIIQDFFDNLSSWKSSFEELGTSYDPLRSSVDGLEVRFECFMEKAQMTAEAGVTLCDDMADLLETIQTHKHPDSKTEKRVQKRAEKLQRACVDMVEKCEKCKENFMQIHKLLYDLLDELEEREHLLRGEIRSGQRKEARARTVAKFATSIGLVASAAATLTTIFFTMGTSAFVVAPIAVSAAAPIVSYFSNSRSNASTKLIEKRLREEDAVQRMIQEASQDSDDVVEMTKWWNGVQMEIVALGGCFERLEWGSYPRLVYSLDDWKTLERRFKDYKDQLKRASRRSSESRKRTSRPSSAGSGSSRSNKSSSHSHDKVGSESIRVRRVNDPITITSSRRAIAITNSTSRRAL